MTYSHIVGHEQQKDILRRAVETGRLAHAYLFEGPEGTGKRLMALALVRHLFCQNGNGCGDCIPCRKIDHHNHPDLHFLEPEGTAIKIDQVRRLQRELTFHPLEGSRKVCLIEAAEKLNPAAGNALLKTLEEPTGRALLILLSSNSEAVLGTIRSRCQRLPFSRISAKKLEGILRDQLNIEEAQAHVLAALSEGSFKKAMGKNRDLYLDRRPSLIKDIASLSPNSIIPLFDLAHELAEEKETLPEILEILQAFYRDMLLFLHGVPELELVNIDLLEHIRRAGRRETPSSLLRKIEAVSAARRHLDRNVNKELALDVLLMKLAA